MNYEKLKTTRRIALFRETKLDFVAVLENHSAKDDWTMDDFVRLTEWQTVEFKELPAAELAAVETKALTELRAKTVAEFTEKLSYIDGRIANLRALTGPEVVS